MNDTYKGREQTLAKHFILRSYLQALAFKILSKWDELTYVDGFSGPWHSKTEDFSDTSFRIAIDVLKDAQSWFEGRGEVKTIRCFLVEKDPTAYKQLKAAVSSYHDPANQLFIETQSGQFEDAVPQIVEFVGKSFSLTFIDPTGWTGYPYDKIKPLLRHRPGEVLINFMYDFINRFAHSPDTATETSLAPILGGAGWKDRLDSELPVGRAVEKLFREELEKTGEYDFVTSTRIDKSTVDRPHFFLAYGTRNVNGLVAFREVEWSALKKHEGNRTGAKLDKKEQTTGTPDLFRESDPPEDQFLTNMIEELKMEASPFILDLVGNSGGRPSFFEVRTAVLRSFMLRETNVKDICVGLAEEGKIRPSWKNRGSRIQKPGLHDLIILIE